MSAPLKYSYDFDRSEPGQTSSSIYRLVEAGGPRVLDVGSGPAIVSTVLQREAGKQVTCLDLDGEALAVAAEQGLETVVADLESEQVFEALAGREFDTVVLADVLEHLRDPAGLLERVLRTGLLAPDGQLVISVPNATHGSVLAELVAGDFRYTTTGILDYTHLRWFTLRSLTRLLEGVGLGVVTVLRTTRGIGHLGTARTTEAVATVAALTRELPEVDTYQYVVRVRRMDEAGTLTVLRSRLEEAEAALRDERAQAGRTRAEVEAALATEREALATEREALVAARAALATAREQADRVVEPPCLPAHAQQHEADQAELEHLRRLLAEEQEHAIDELRRAAEPRSTVLPEVAPSPVRISELERRAETLEREVRAVRASESYRFGHALVRRAQRVQRLVTPRRSG